MKVSSPQICRVLDHGLQQGRMFQAVERLQGQSLAEAMTSNPGPMSEAQTKAMAIQILLGLEAAHMGGLTHSNLVPANVFVDSRFFFFITFEAAHMGGLTHSNLVPANVFVDNRKHQSVGSWRRSLGA
jgi:serine/threonine protein kinase